MSRIRWKPFLPPRCHHTAARAPGDWSVSTMTWRHRGDQPQFRNALAARTYGDHKDRGHQDVPSNFSAAARVDLSPLSVGDGTDNDRRPAARQARLRAIAMELGRSPSTVSRDPPQHPQTLRHLRAADGPTRRRAQRSRNRTGKIAGNPEPCRPSRLYRCLGRHCASSIDPARPGKVHQPRGPDPESNQQQNSPDIER
jgi:hypothetical protein